MKISYRVDCGYWDFGIIEPGKYGRWYVEDNVCIDNYECSYEDFVKWFKNKSELLKDIVVINDKNEMWIWCKESKNKLASGWSFIKKMK